MNIHHWLRTTRIAVLYGGTSAEREISLASGAAVLKALRELRANVVGIDAGAHLPAALKKNKIAFAYLALHGPLGEDGAVQGLLEVMGIPYTGCGILASAVAMDKIATKQLWDAHRLPTPAWAAIIDGKPAGKLPGLPLVIKPATQGSAIGVSMVHRKAELPKALRTAQAYDRRVLAEKFIAGTEITVGILGDRALPVIEIVPDGAFYDFTSKYTPGKSQHLIPPRLDKKIVKTAQELALRAFAALGCRAISRIDLIVDRAGQPWLLEANTIPGMTATSLFPDAARAAGLSFNDLILKIIEHSLAAR
jgi:D-alanine-D-alanine ligase